MFSVKCDDPFPSVFLDTIYVTKPFKRAGGNRNRLLSVYVFGLILSGSTFFNFFTTDKLP